jgi:hypothetical protein
MRRRGMHTGFVVRKPEEKRPLGKIPSRRSEDNIKINLRKIGWGFMDCINLAHDRDQWWTLVNKIMNLGVPYNLRNLWVAERLSAYKGPGSMKLVGFIYKTSDNKGKDKIFMNLKAVSILCIYSAQNPVNVIYSRCCKIF